VTIPGYISPLTRFVNILPGPLRDALFGALVPDQVKTASRESRAGYEQKFE